MGKFLKSNETVWRLARTMAQGIIGVIVANIDLIVSQWSFSTEIKPMIVALVMCVLSPVMAEIGKGGQE